MHDVVTFSSERIDNRLVAVARGFDTHSRPVEFVMDPVKMLVNLFGIQDFLQQLAAAWRHLTAMLASGWPAAHAWTTIEAMLPNPVQLRTALHQVS
jgi:hypothetical protein